MSLFQVIKPMFGLDRKSTRLNSSHDQISYAVFCLKKKKERYKWRLNEFEDKSSEPDVVVENRAETSHRQVWNDQLGKAQPPGLTESQSHRPVLCRSRDRRPNR